MEGTVRCNKTHPLYHVTLPLAGPLCSTQRLADGVQPARDLMRSSLYKSSVLDPAFFTGRLCWTRWAARWGSTHSGYHVTLPLSVLDPTCLQVVCVGRGGQPDGVQPTPDLMLPSLLQVVCVGRGGQSEGVQLVPRSHATISFTGHLSLTRWGARWGSTRP
jgi:hypothetical protein